MTRRIRGTLEQDFYKGGTLEQDFYKGGTTGTMELEQDFQILCLCLFMFSFAY